MAQLKNCGDSGKSEFAVIPACLVMFNENVKYFSTVRCNVRSGCFFTSAKEYKVLQIDSLFSSGKPSFMIIMARVCTDTSWISFCDCFKFYLFGVQHFRLRLAIRGRTSE